MNKIDELIQWVKDGQGSRHVEIDIEETGNVKVWIYDYKLMTGEHIKLDGDIPNLEEVKHQNELKKLEELQSKYGKVDKNE